MMCFLEKLKLLGNNAYLGRAMRKNVFKRTRTAKARIVLCMRAV